MIAPVAVNYLAVLVSAIASMLLGFLWYGPLFGKTWMKLMKWDPKKMGSMKANSNMALSYGITFVGSLVMAYVLAHIVGYTQAKTLMDGVVAGFWTWLGFIATVSLGKVLWEGKSWNLYMLDNAYHLVNLVVMGIILTLWV